MPSTGSSGRAAPPDESPEAIPQGLSVYRSDGATVNPTSAEGQQVAAAVRHSRAGRRHGSASVPQPAQRVEINPFGEFTKGMTEGFDDLVITGENVGRLAGGQELKETTGNVLTKSIDTMIDAFTDDNPDDWKQIRQGFGKIGQDFWGNPARAIGRLMPEIAITAASVFAPPVAAARWGTHAVRIGTKVASKAAKAPMNRGQFALGDPVSFAKANPNYVPTKVYTGSQTMEDIFGKGFVATARSRGKAQQAWKDVLAQNTKTSNNILKLGNRAKVGQPHANSRIFDMKTTFKSGLKTPRGPKHKPGSKTTIRQNRHGSGTATKLIVKPKVRPLKRTRLKTTTKPVKRKPGQSTKTAKRNKPRTGAAAGAGVAAGLSLSSLWQQKGKSGSDTMAVFDDPQLGGRSGKADHVFFTEPGGTLAGSETIYDDPPPGWGTGGGMGRSQAGIPASSPLPSALMPFPAPWRKFPFGGGSGGGSNPSGSGSKAFREWATAGVFESVAIGKHVDSMSDNVEGWFAGPRKAAGAPRRKARTTKRKAAGAPRRKAKTTKRKAAGAPRRKAKTTKRKAAGNPFAGFWGLDP